MTDFVKKKIVEKLARFTKDLKPSDISFGFLSGKGELTDLELNCDFITEALQLPPWIRVAQVKCDTIRARVPFTNLRNEPIKIVIGMVTIEVTTTTDETARKKQSNLLNQLGSSPSKYGYTEKVIDGMKVEIRSIIVNFRDPTFQARFEISDIVIQSTTPSWQPASLPHTRYKDLEEESVIIYKMCVIGSVKIEGWSTVGVGVRGSLSTRAKLRLIAGETNIRVTLKRKIDDCSILHTRVVVHLGDVMWILSQSQLRAVSRLIQTLMGAAVRMSQKQREEKERQLEATDGNESISGESVMSEEGGGRGGDGKSPRKKSDKKSKGKDKSGLSQKEVNIKKRVYEYRSGKKNIPTYEIIQNSFHLTTGTIDLQFCDDMSTESPTNEERNETDRPSSRSTVEGSMLVRLKELQVDVYLDQPAGQGKYHWNKANDLIIRNVKWSENLIKRASKTQHMDLPSVSLQYLHERGIVVRCADFSVEALCSDTSQESELPLIMSDKRTFNIPEDMHNPAFQVGVTLYFYPEAYGTKFLIPRPNIYIHCSPVHLTLHQQSCLWIVEFIHGVVATINLDLAMSVQVEGKAFLDERKAQSNPTHQLPGVDVDFKILFTKITMPLPETYRDGRPRALQLETASISVRNFSLDTLLQDGNFKSALDGMEKGWVFASHGTDEFPHFQGDFPAVPPWLKELLNYKLRSSRLGLVAELPSSPLERPTSPMVVQNSELMHTEAWHFHTSCVHLSFTKSDRYEDTLRPKDFVDDFPLHLWVFLPQKKREGEGFFGTAAPRSPTSPSPSPSPSLPENDRPMISFLAHVSDPIRAELERLQLLFLLRLKDSFAAFKTSIMKFLTLTPPEAVVEELMSPVTPRVWGEEGAEPSVEEGEREWEGGMSGEGEGGEERAASSVEHEGAGPDESSQSSGKKTISATIGGCVVVRSVQADILLPSLYVSKPSKGTNTEANTPVTGPPSPSSSLLTGIALGTGTGSSQTPDRSETQSPTGVGRATSPPRRPPPPPPPLAAAQHASSTLTPKFNISGSETSLHSQSSQTSQTGQSTVSSFKPPSSQSGSQTSLPALLPTGTTLQAEIHSRRTQTHYASSSEISTGRHLHYEGHGRSLSASNIMPSFGKTGPTLAPSPLTSILSVPDVTLSREGIEGRGSGTVEVVSAEVTVSATQTLQTGGGGMKSSSLQSSTEEYVFVQSPEVPGQCLERSVDSGSEGVEVGREARDVSPMMVLPTTQGTSPVAMATGVEPREVRSDVGGGERAEWEGERTERGVERSKEGAGEGDGEGVSEDKLRGQEVEDTLTPLTVSNVSKRAFPFRRTSTTSSLRSIGSSKREKLPPLLRAEPQYVLRIGIQNISALPNIQANEISLRASVGDLKLEELNSTSADRSQTKRKQSENESEGGVPVIKARVEVGSQVQRFNLPPSVINGKKQDTVVMLKLSGLGAALLVKNAPVLKDFFDDEFEADAPVPIQICVEDTTVLLREDLDYSTDTDSSLNVHIFSADIHRGRKIEGTNLFRHGRDETREGSVELETLRVGVGAALRERSPGVRDNDSTASNTSNPDLLQTFRSFIDVFESHILRHGGLKVQLNQPEHIAGLLQELQVSLSEEDTNRERGDGSEAPPPFSDSAKPDASPATKARMAELKRLRQENKEMRKIQMENEDLITQLTQTKVLLAERSQDLDQVTSECKKTKDELVTHKQVLENYQEHIERLLSENADLKGHISGGVQ